MATIHDYEDKGRVCFALRESERERGRVECEIDNAGRNQPMEIF